MAGPRHKSGPTANRRKLAPLLAFLAMAALYRMSENALQTSYAPFGRNILSLTTPEIGTAVSVGGVITILANLALVVRGPRHRLNRSLFFGLSAITLAIIVLSVGRSIPTYFASTIFLGLASGLVMPSLTTVAGRLRGISQDRALAAFTVALTGSLAIGPLLESLALRANGDSLPVALLIFVPCALASMVLFAFVARHSVPVKPTNSASEPTTRLDGPYPLRIAIVAQLINQIPFVTVITFGVLIGHALYGTSTATMQLAFTVFFGAAVVVRLALVWRAHQPRTRLLLNFGALPMIVGLVALALGHDPTTLFVAMMVLGTSHGLMFPLAISLVARETPAHKIAKANAALFTATSAASMITPVLIGTSLAYLGYRTTLLLVGITVVTLAGTNLLLFHQMLKTRLSPPTS